MPPEARIGKTSTICAAGWNILFVYGGGMAVAVKHIGFSRMVVADGDSASPQTDFSEWLPRYLDF